MVLFGIEIPTCNKASTCKIYLWPTAKDHN